MGVDRPGVTVVMPFAGDRAAAEAAAQSLRSLQVQPGDELILVDNSVAGAAAELPVAEGSPAVRVLVSRREHSPAHARNAGAAQAQNQWILFLDADTTPRPDLLDVFFEQGIGERVGAVAGEVVPFPDGRTLAARYGAARSFLGQRSHFEHPYRPRAAAANLLVRRSAFEQLAGFYEGVRAGEDTDFTWRLQEAGWRLELRSQAAVMHRYRPTLGELRRQWRGYAAGRAWLGRRYQEFHPQPALARAAGRVRRGGLRHLLRRDAVSSGPLEGVGNREPVEGGGFERTQFLALDLLLGLEELAGFALSNRPSHDDGGAVLGRRRYRRPDRGGGVDVVLIADRFPVRGDPLVELAGTLERVRVEALARPAAAELAPDAEVPVDYLEDDGAASRWTAAAMLTARHPVRSAVYLLKRPPEAPPLHALAPAVRRLQRHPLARIQPLGANHARATAERLARLAGRSRAR